MAQFSDRVSNYPLINDSFKVVSDAYTWVSNGEQFRRVFQLSETAANALKEKAKVIANSDAVVKMDTIACQQILDRIELVFPSVKKPTEDLLGPAADRALTAAESYLEYFLPDTKGSMANHATASRYDRLMCLQSALVNSEKVQTAQNKITGAFNNIQAHLTLLSTVTSKERRETILTSITNQAEEYKKAAEVAFPRFKSFVEGAVTQLQTYASELRHTDNVSQFAVDQIRTTVNGLHNTLLNLNERREKWLRGEHLPTASEAE